MSHNVDPSSTECSGICMDPVPGICTVLTECKRRSGIYSTYIHVTSSPVVTGSVFMQSMYLLMHARNVNYLDYKLINNKAFTQAMEQILFQVEPFEKW